MEFVDSLGLHVDSSFEDANRAYPECEHVAIVKEVVQELIDGPHGISPEHDLTGMYNHTMSL